MWTYSTPHNLVSCNLWPQPQVDNNQKLNTMPMHQNTRGQKEYYHQSIEWPPHWSDAHPCHSQQQQQQLIHQ
jgi:hypothetical protein